MKSNPYISTGAILLFLGVIAGFSLNSLLRLWITGGV